MSDIPFKRKKAGPILDIREEIVSNAPVPQPNVPSLLLRENRSDQRAEMLSEDEIGLMQDVYLSWYCRAKDKTPTYVLPRAIQLELLNCRWLQPEFQNLVQQWLENNLEEKSPFEEHHTDELYVYLKGTVGNFLLKINTDEKTHAEISVDTVRTAIIDRVLLYFLKILTEEIPFRSGSKPINDLYWALRFPSKSKLTFSGQWALGCVYQNLIRPKFGSIESFIKVIADLLEQSEGHGNLITWNFSYTILEELFPPDHNILKIADILLCLVNGDRKTSMLGLVYQQYMLDNQVWQENDSKRWSAADQAEARRVLEPFDKDHFVARFRIRAEQVLRDQQKDS